jgi:hypothetical protein
MKAITIIQPYATLIAVGEKRFETRSWAAKYRGPLAIHAGKKVDSKACQEPEIAAALAQHGYTADTLPTGAVIAVSELSACQEIHIDHKGDAVLLHRLVPVFWIGRDNKEFAFGFYESGRYAWELANVKQLPEPIPAKGQLSLWNWEGVQQP